MGKRPAVCAPRRTRLWVGVVPPWYQTERHSEHFRHPQTACQSRNRLRSPALGVLITRRSRVRIPPPRYSERPCMAGPFLFFGSLACMLVVPPWYQPEAPISAVASRNAEGSRCGWSPRHTGGGLPFVARSSTRPRVASVGGGRVAKKAGRSFRSGPHASSESGQIFCPIDLNLLILNWPRSFRARDPGVVRASVTAERLAS